MSQINMQTKNQIYCGQKSNSEHLSLRVSSDEKSTIIEQANLAGLSTLEYIRRKLFANR